MKQTITDIQPHPQLHSYQQLYLNQKPATVIHTGLVEKFGLRIGLEIEARVIERIVAADEEMQAKNYALRLLREEIYSKTQMTRQLKRQGYGENTVKTIITELIQSGHIRDMQFAEKWIQKRLRTNPRGKTLLKQELIDKGVDRETAEQAIAEVKIEDEETLALQIAQKQARHYRNLPLHTARRRLHGYLARRGYESDVILRIIQELF